MIINMCIFYSGCLVGSFFYCVAGLWTRGQFHVLIRSQCDHCHNRLKWYELLPIVSFLIQRGKCRHCHYALAPIYILSECLTGCLFLHAFIHFDQLTSQHTVTCLLLLFMSYCDLCEHWVPDTLQVSLLAWLLYQFTWQGQDTILFSFSLVLFACFGLFFYFMRRDWIGGADIKLLLILKLAVPVIQFPMFLFIAASLGLLFWFSGDFRSKGLPFIPFIACSFYIVCVYL